MDNWFLKTIKLSQNYFSNLLNSIDLIILLYYLYGPISWYLCPTPLYLLEMVALYDIVYIMCNEHYSNVTVKVYYKS